MSTARELEEGKKKYQKIQASSIDQLIDHALHHLPPQLFPNQIFKNQPNPKRREKEFQKYL